MSTYWCCLFTRDGAETLGPTLSSILSQTVPPSYVIVVNDGSTDGTSNILSQVSQAFGALHVVNTYSRTRDIRRAPWLLNLALKAAEQSPEVRYMMISGDDCRYPLDYAARIMEKMDAEKNVMVASGDSGVPSAPNIGRMPRGSGRFVRMDFMESIGGKYPVAYGWESWLLLEALRQGKRVRNFDDMRFKHLRRHRARNVQGWGRGMYSLGYPFYFVLLRFLKNLLMPGSEMGLRTSIAMLSGYVASLVNPSSLGTMIIEDRVLRGFVGRACAARVVGLLVKR